MAHRVANWQRHRALSTGLPTAPMRETKLAMAQKWSHGLHNPCTQVRPQRFTARNTISHGPQEQIPVTIIPHVSKQCLAHDNRMRENDITHLWFAGFPTASLKGKKSAMPKKWVDLLHHPCCFWVGGGGGWCRATLRSKDTRSGGPEMGIWATSPVPFGGGRGASQTLQSVNDFKWG